MEDKTQSLARKPTRTPDHPAIAIELISDSQRGRQNCSMQLAPQTEPCEVVQEHHSSSSLHNLPRERLNRQNSSNSLRRMGLRRDSSSRSLSRTTRRSLPRDSSSRSLQRKSRTGSGGEGSSQSIQHSTSRGLERENSSNSLQRGTKKGLERENSSHSSQRGNRRGLERDSSSSSLQRRSRSSLNKETSLRSLQRNTRADLNAEGVSLQRSASKCLDRESSSRSLQRQTRDELIRENSSGSIHRMSRGNLPRQSSSGSLQRRSRGSLHRQRSARALQRGEKLKKQSSVTSFNSSRGSSLNLKDASTQQCTNGDLDWVDDTSFGDAFVVKKESASPCRESSRQDISEELQMSDSENGEYEITKSFVANSNSDLDFEWRPDAAAPSLFAPSIANITILPPPADVSHRPKRRCSMNSATSTLTDLSRPGPGPSKDFQRSRMQPRQQRRSSIGASRWKDSGSIAHTNVPGSDSQLTNKPMRPRAQRRSSMGASRSNDPSFIPSAQRNNSIRKTTKKNSRRPMRRRSSLSGATTTANSRRKDSQESYHQSEDCSLDYKCPEPQEQPDNQSSMISGSDDPKIGVSEEEADNDQSNDENDYNYEDYYGSSKEIERPSFSDLESLPMVPSLGRTAGPSCARRLTSNNVARRQQRRLSM